jgi:hypothetical protein
LALTASGRITKENTSMATFLERKDSKQEDQMIAELKRWWTRHPNASMLELEAMARDLGLRGTRRFPFSLLGKRERPAARA